MQQQNGMEQYALAQDGVVYEDRTMRHLVWKTYWVPPAVVTVSSKKRWLAWATPLSRWEKLMIGTIIVILFVDIVFLGVQLV